MPPADRPYRTRPLAGVDQALGEGRAREPTELLDRLRERLDRLEPNHPSARPTEASAELTEPVEPAEPVDEVARPAESTPDSRSESSTRPKNGADQSSGYKPVDRDAGQPPPPAVDPAGEPAASASAPDQHRIVEIGRLGQGDRSGQGERYRPWFADPWSADEPGAPWFVE